MEEAKQNIKQKKDSYNLRIVTAVLVLTVLVLGELYVMINYPSNYVALIVLTVVALADITNSMIICLSQKKLLIL